MKPHLPEEVEDDKTNDKQYTGDWVAWDRYVQGHIGLRNKCTESQVNVSNKSV